MYPKVVNATKYNTNNDNTIKIQPIICFILFIYSLNKYLSQLLPFEFQLTDLSFD